MDTLLMICSELTFYLLSPPLSLLHSKMSPFSLRWEKRLRSRAIPVALEYTLFSHVRVVSCFATEKEGEDNKKKSKNTIHVKNNTGHLTRESILHFKMIACLCFPSLYNILAKDDMENRCLRH